MSNATTTDRTAAGLDPVTHDEAEKIVKRFIASHFDEADGKRVRISIPADPRRDDDLRLCAYIDQCRATAKEQDAELRRLRAVVGTVRDLATAENGMGADERLDAIARAATSPLSTPAATEAREERA